LSVADSAVVKPIRAIKLSATTNRTRWNLLRHGATSANTFHSQRLHTLQPTSLPLEWQIHYSQPAYH